jgi:hypothetical protein
MLCDGIEDLVDCDELNEIDEKLRDEIFSEEEVDPNDLDKAMYKVPDTDEGYRKILKERFGHDDFLEG